MSDSPLEDLSYPTDDPPPLKFVRRTYAWDFERKGVRFWGKAGNKAVLCLVTVEALQDHFQLSGSGGPLASEAFASGRRRIEALAIQKWNARALESDGSIRLRSEDF